MEINDFTSLFVFLDRPLINGTVPHIYIYPIFITKISTRRGKVPLQVPIVFRFLKSIKMAHN